MKRNWIRSVMVLVGASVLLCGCADKERLAELEKVKISLESENGKLKQELSQANGLLKSKDADLATLQQQLLAVQTELQKVKKPAAPAKKTSKKR